MHMQASLKLIPEALLAPAGKKGWREFVRICPGVFYSSCLWWQIGTNLFTVPRSNCDDQWAISPESRNNKRPDSCCLAVVFSCCNLVFSYSLTFGVCFRQRSEKHRLFVPYCLQTGSGGFQYLSQTSYWNPVSHPSLLPPPKSTGPLPWSPPLFMHPTYLLSSGLFSHFRSSMHVKTNQRGHVVHDGMQLDLFSFFPSRWTLLFDISPTYGLMHSSEERMSL